MVYRDPETGQYVSGDSDMEYRDYEFQHIAAEYDIDADALPEGLPVLVEDINVVELDDLLHRDEQADLVAVIVHSLQASIPGTSSAESALRTQFELSTGTGSQMIGGTDDEAGATGDIDTRVWTSDDPDILFFAHWFAEGSFADSTNGLGGGPDQPVLDQTTHFPRDFGACPAYDERDEITESVRFSQGGSADISDSLIELNVDYTLVFSVSER